MEIPEPYERPVPKYLLKQVRKQLDLVSELAQNIEYALGKTNAHAQRLTMIAHEFKAAYAAMAKSEPAAVQEELDEETPEELDLAAMGRPRKKGVKNSARLNTHHLDNINYYIRHLQSEQDIYLLYEFFDLIVAKVKEYGAYDAKQIWEGIKNEVALKHNKSVAQDIRDILDNHELREGLSMYASVLQDKQAGKAG